MLFALSGAHIEVVLHATSIARVGAGSTTSDYSGVTSGSLASAVHSITTGNTNLVCVTHFSSTSATVASMADTGGINAYSSLVRVINGTEVVDLWAATGITGNASNTVTATMSASDVRYWSIEQVQYSGLVASTVLAMKDLSATGTSTSSPVTTTAWGPTTQADTLLFACGRNSAGSVTWSAGTMGTGTGALVVSDASQSATTEERFPDAIQTGSSNVTSLSSTGTPPTFQIVFAALKAAGAAAPCPKTRTLLGVGC